MTETRVPIILDCDTGVDDALALALAVRSPRCDLVAVTTLAGNVDIERTTANTLAVLDLLGATGVPVHRGASRPLVRPHVDAVYAHGTDGLGTARLPPSARALGPDRGPAAIVRLANAQPGEITLVCVGPLTNLAIALNVEPRLPDLLRRVVVMGGSFWEGGNVTPHAEFNTFCDPEAAAQVFAAPFVDLTVVGLDVTHQTTLPRAIWEATIGSIEPDRRLLDEVARHSFTERRLEGLFLHDPLSVGVALDSSLVGTVRGEVRVTVDGEERGTTRVVGSGTTRVARTVDAARFVAGFRATLGLSDLGGGAAMVEGVGTSAV